jgi:hypothetical protein
MGGNAGEVAKAAVEGAIEGASEVGRTAVKAVTDMLVGVVEGVKGVGGAALPTSPPKAALPPEEKAPSSNAPEGT